MEAYSSLARYYDILMNDFDYNGYYDFIESYIVGNGVDLACGSGIMTNMLSNIADNIIGVDCSLSMLNEAMQKNSKDNITYIQQDIVKFDPKEKKDFVTCVCDGFNYLSNKKLEKAIQKISSYIKKDGYFIFDISSEYKLKNIISNNIFFEDYENLTYMWLNDLKKDSLNMQLSFFEKQKDNTYRRYDEQHKQYIHSKIYLENLLKDNFSFKVYDGTTYKKVKGNTQRLLFICKRK